MGLRQTITVELTKEEYDVILDLRQKAASYKVKRCLVHDFSSTKGVPYGEDYWVCRHCGIPEPK